MSEPCVIAMGGGGFSSEPDNPLLEDYILSQVSSPAPRICFLPTASGDADSYIVKFYDRFGSVPCRPTHLSLFRRRTDDLRSFLLDQEIVYVGGGNTANMLAAWRLHGVDRILHEAWSRGIVLCGLSAGSVCWFESGVTDSFGPRLQALPNCLGILAGSHCPHYDGEAMRRPTYHKLVGEGILPGGVAADDGVALKYVGTELTAVVASREQARAWRVTLRDGRVCEEEVPTRFLG